MFEHLPAWMNAAAMAAAAALIWPLGARLARLADVFGEKTGLGGGLTGLLLLGSLTSLPELAVSVTATLSGAPLLSVNDVLGSAAVNVLILAIADALHGRRALTAMPGRPDVLLQASLSTILLLLVPAAVLVGDRLVLGMGLWSWVLLASYGLAVWVVAKARDLHSWTPQKTTDSPADAERSRSTRKLEQLEARDRQLSGGQLGGRIALAGAVILVGGFVLARSGDALAQQTGLGTSFVGAVLLALCTSLPEVSTVLAAVRMRRYELALGDVFGTNLFNMTILALVDALHDGNPVLAEAGRFAAFAGLLAAAMTVVFLIGMIERRNHSFFRMGLDSIAALVLYLAGIAVLYGLRDT
jgi:cation:H+ antiporter